jgi:hypothetical protein
MKFENYKYKYIYLFCCSERLGFNRDIFFVPVNLRALLMILVYFFFPIIVQFLKIDAICYLNRDIWTLKLFY